MIYKYYDQLDNLDDVKTEFILTDDNYLDLRKNHHININNISTNIMFSSLLEDIAVLNDLISFYPEHIDCYYNELNKKIILSSYEFRILLDCYKHYIRNLLNDNIYPQLNLFFNTFLKKVEMYSENIKNNETILLPIDNKYTYKWSNAWYLTNNGYLYNSNYSNHHYGSTYGDYLDFMYMLKENKIIPHINNSKKIAEILKCGYVTKQDLDKTVNMIYDYDLLIPSNNTSISYQKDIVDIVIGYLSTKEELSWSFEALNTSCDKRNNLNTLLTLTNNYYPDILVRYVGLSKIESSLSKTITTSSINIEKFREYLHRGWNLEIIPKIIYDKKIDTMVELKLNSSFIKDYLEEEIRKNNYKGKIKVLQ